MSYMQILLSKGSVAPAYLESVVLQERGKLNLNVWVSEFSDDCQHRKGNLIDKNFIAFKSFYKLSRGFQS